MKINFRIFYFFLIFVAGQNTQPNDAAEATNPGKSNKIKYLEQTLIAKLFGGQGNWLLREIRAQYSPLAIDSNRLQYTLLKPVKV